VICISSEVSFVAFRSHGSWRVLIYTGETTASYTVNIQIQTTRMKTYDSFQIPITQSNAYVLVIADEPASPT
jgi:hypothetical protein